MEFCSILTHLPMPLASCTQQLLHYSTLWHPIQ
uniref:Uncharacterized protein n=1 Tax=Anguilla anguilla TaxID=7936 RepID=A0A0E9WM56_ANGAN